MFDLGDRQDEAESKHRLGSPMDDNLQKNKLYEKGKGTEGYSSFRCVGGRKVVDLSDFPDRDRNRKGDKRRTS